MSRNYKFHDPDGVYFVSFAVIEWIDVFTRTEYKDLLLESLDYCRKNKGMEIFAWCIMSNHFHLVFKVNGNNTPANVLGDFKRFTSHRLIKTIQTNPKESRKGWLLYQFKKAAAKTSNTSDHQFWRHDNKPIQLWSNKVIEQKINYIHKNPVKDELVEKPEHYLYSSARDYAGETGRLKEVSVIRWLSS